MTPLEIYKQQNGIAEDSAFIDLINKVFSDAFNIGLDCANKMQLISQEFPENPIQHFSEETWDERHNDYIYALLRRRKRQDDEYVAAVNESIKYLLVLDETKE